MDPVNPRVQIPPSKRIPPRVVVPDLQPKEFECPSPSSGSFYPRVVFRLSQHISIPSGETGVLELIYTVPKTCMLVIETVSATGNSGVNEYYEAGMVIQTPGPLSSVRRYGMAMPYGRSTSITTTASTYLKHSFVRNVRVYALPGDQISVGANHIPGRSLAIININIFGYLLHHESPSLGP